MQTNMTVNPDAVLAIATCAISALTALLSLVTYLYLRRRFGEVLLLANVLICCTVFALCEFFTDMAISGRDGLHWFRVQFIAAAIGMASLAHFTVICFVPQRPTGVRFIPFAYVIGFAFSVLAFVPSLIFIERSEPRGEGVVDWLNVMPFAPAPGPLYKAFLIYLIFLVSFIFFQLWRYYQTRASIPNHLLPWRVKPILAGIVILVITGIVDGFLAGLGFMTISFTLLGIVTVCTSILIALLLEMEDKYRQIVQAYQIVQEQAIALRESKQHLVIAQDEERQRIERDLHDGVQAHMVDLSLRLNLLRNQIQSEPLGKHLDDLFERAKAVIQQLRDFCHGIYPPVLRDLGLIAALENRCSAVPCAVHLQVNETLRNAHLPPEVSTNLYFIANEALNNVVKHAHASEISLTLQYNTNQIEMGIRDNGVGFNLNAVLLGAGWSNMRDRAEAIGGSVTINSLPGWGTEVTATVPFVASPSGEFARQAGEGNDGESDRHHRR